MIAAAESQPRFAVLPPRRPAEPILVAEAAEPVADVTQPFGEDGLSFLDVLDVINPLQHLPVVSTLYREWTGDTLSPAARIAGDILYGGPIGAFIGINNAITEGMTGKDIGQHVLAWLRGGDQPDPPNPPPPQLADAGFDPPTAGATVPVPNPVAVAALQAMPAPIPLDTEPALATTQARDEGASIVDPRRVTFAPPARSRLPLAPADTIRVPVKARTPAAPSPTPVLPEPGRAPPFAVVPPAAAPLFGPGATRAATTETSVPPAGSAALDGGWFSDTMLAALHKYQQGIERKPAGAQAHGSADERYVE